MMQPRADRQDLGQTISTSELLVAQISRELDEREGNAARIRDDSCSDQFVDRTRRQVGEKLASGGLRQTVDGEARKRVRGMDGFARAVAHAEQERDPVGLQS